MAAEYTERQVQNALYWFLKHKGHKWTMPGFSPGGWWESDIYSITGSGYGYEYEIKLSKADFQKDALKSVRLRHLNKKSQPILKYDEIIAGRGPRAFYYVVPEPLLEKLEIPEWAGVLVFGVHRKRMWFREVKPPRQLHRNKVTDAVIDQLKVACYWRFWAGRRKNLEK
jgi:hypothetical protein